MAEKFRGQVKVGTKAWFATPYRGADVAEFVQPTEVEVAPLAGNAYHYTTVGRVPGFPEGHPPILLPKEQVELY